MTGASKPSLRPAEISDAAAIARVHVTSWRETYVGILPETLLARLSEDDRTRRWTAMLDQTPDPEGLSVIVAETGGEIVGFLAVSRQKDPALLAAGFTSEIGSIYVLASSQGLGLGRALMRAGAILQELAYGWSDLTKLMNDGPG